jgi:dihydrofolate reductase
MRKVIFAINVSLDGCCDHTKMIGDEAIHEYFADLIRGAGLLAYGRITYQLMVPYWPEIAKNKSGQTKAANDFAQAFDSVDKIVFSRSLDKVEDRKSRLVRKSLAAEIGELKQEEGAPILLGGVDLPSQLIELGLVDEFNIVVLPIVVGEGRRLFEAARLPERLPLKLVESKVLKAGQVALRYVKQ